MLKDMQCYWNTIKQFLCVYYAKLQFTQFTETLIEYELKNIKNSLTIRKKKESK